MKETIEGALSHGRRAKAAGLCAAFLALACALGMAGCASSASVLDCLQEVDVSDTSGGVAATVNGTEIGENAISAYIANFRAVNELDDDDAWGSWLIDYAYTIDSVRGDTLEMFENQLLVAQAAEENGITVTDEEVDAAIQEERDLFDSDEEWEQYVAAMAFPEQGHREQMRLSLLSEKLMDAVTDEDDDDSARMQAYVEYMNEYRDNADIEESFLPDDAPYYIDLAPYEEAARLTDGDSSTAEEADSGESADASADASADEASAAAAGTEQE